MKHVKVFRSKNERVLPERKKRMMLRYFRIFSGILTPVNVINVINYAHVGGDRCGKLLHKNIKKNNNFKDTKNADGTTNKNTIKMALSNKAE